MQAQLLRIVLILFSMVPNFGFAGISAFHADFVRAIDQRDYPKELSHLCGLVLEDPEALAAIDEALRPLSKWPQAWSSLRSAMLMNGEAPDPDFFERQPVEAFKMIFTMLRKLSKQGAEDSSVRRMATLLIHRMIADDQKIAAVMYQENHEIQNHYGRNWSADFTGGIINTPLNAVHELGSQLRKLRPRRVIDIGSGHGLPFLMLGDQFKNTEFIGFDIVRAKVNVANEKAEKLGLKNVSFIDQDLGDPQFSIPEADAYYLYNPLSENVLMKVVRQIHAIGLKRPVMVYSFGLKGTSVPPALLSVGCTYKETSGELMIYTCAPVVEHLEFTDAD